MQNGSLENDVDANHVNSQQHDEVEQPPLSNEPEAQNTVDVNQQAFLENAEPQYEEDNGNDEPPNKKRKLTDPPKESRHQDQDSHRHGKRSSLKDLHRSWKKAEGNPPVQITCLSSCKHRRINVRRVLLSSRALLQSRANTVARINHHR